MNQEPLSNITIYEQMNPELGTGSTMEIARGLVIHSAIENPYFFKAIY